MIIFVKQNTE